jgi:glycosyltransferase involved in cell wall biosynthesis
MTASAKLTAVFSAPFVGGSELFNLEFLRTARAHGIEVHAVVPGPGAVADAIRPIAANLQILAIPQALTELSRFDRPSGAGIARAATATVAYATRLRRALTNTGGVVCCMGFRSQLAVGVLAPTLRRPIAWVVHEVVPPGPFARLWRHASRRPDAILTYSRTAAAQPGLRGSGARVLAVRFDLAAFESVPPPVAPPRTVGLVGDLFPLKNHVAAIELVRRLRDRKLDVRGLLVGRDPSRPRPAESRYAAAVRAAVATPGAHVELTAATPDEMPQVMKRMDVLLHLSTVEESFGRVCVEAMAAGRPVVAYGHGAVPEIVTDGETGYVCPPGDLDSVEKTVAALVQDRARFLRISDQARRDAGARFGEHQRDETIGDALVALARSYAAKRCGDRV